jgi:hypothetical protein
MAPKPEGFNLWGYLLPGSAILVAGGALVAFISRRKVAVAEAAVAYPGPRPASTGTATPEEVERLRRALAEVED